MRKFSMTSFLFQLLDSTIVLMAEANTNSGILAKGKEGTADIKDAEMETNQEKDVFPDLITFAMHIYQ